MVMFLQGTGTKKNKNPCTVLLYLCLCLGSGKASVKICVVCLYFYESNRFLVSYIGYGFPKEFKYYFNGKYALWEDSRSGFESLL